MISTEECIKAEGELIEKIDWDYLYEVEHNK